MKFLSPVSAVAIALGLAAAAPAAAQQSRTVSEQAQVPAAARQASDADLMDLADYADLVIRAEVRRQNEVKAERAPGLRPGFARFYVEAETRRLLAGSVPVGERVRYLVDLPRDPRGRAPRLKGEEVLLFARPVPARPGELVLVAPDAQLSYNEALGARVRSMLEQLVASDAAPRIVGVRDALSVAGTLAGESETQIFLETRDGSPAAISVVRRPDMRPTWGISFSEIVDQSVRVPERGSLASLRLACALPDRLPGEANLSREPADRARAADDYEYVVSQIERCDRLRERPTLPYRPSGG